MGLGGISIWQLLIIAAIVMMLFGTKKLRHVGTDMGMAFRGFKRAVSDVEAKSSTDDDDVLIDEPRLKSNG